MTNEELLTNLRAGIDSAASTISKESFRRNHAWGRGAKTAFTAVYHMLDLAAAHITEPRDAGPTETEPTSEGRISDPSNTCSVMQCGPNGWTPATPLDYPEDQEQTNEA